MGTPNFAVPALQLLSRVPTFEVVCVFTRPDTVSGRGKALRPSPVKEFCLQHGIRVETPKDFSDEKTIELLREMNPELIVVASYGVILPKEVLEIPKYGCINIHASLLPTWRGAAPIERAILAGDSEVGISIMKMQEGLDSGPWCLKKSISPGIRDRHALTLALAKLGAEALLETLPRIISGEVIWIDQNHDNATYAKKIHKAELRLNPADSAEVNCRKVRASSDHAPAKAIVCTRPCSIISADIPRFKQDSEIQSDSLAPGEVIYKDKRLFLTTADGIFEVKKIKPDGKREMDAQEFAAGIHSILSKEAKWEPLA